jgi:tRNA pseudouridine32 synthase/23S rRNA pseudouridine746 synthase
VVATAKILFEDDAVLAVAKPAGIVVVPARNEDPAASLRHVLERERGERLWVVHRLDRDTSGVVLFARTADAHRALNTAFERHEARKTYWAVVRAAPPAVRGTIGVPLHGARKGKMRPASPGEEGAQAALTEYDVLGGWNLPALQPALLEVRPRTGRQHQVRVHLRSVGAPLLVDPLYGGSSTVTERGLGLAGERVLCSRLTLHALRLECPVPWQSEPLRVEAPIPEDLAGLLQALDAAAQAADSGAGSGSGSGPA